MESNILVALTAMPFGTLTVSSTFLTDSSILTLPTREVIKLQLLRREKVWVDAHHSSEDTCQSPLCQDTKPGSS